MHGGRRRRAYSAAAFAGAVAVSDSLAASLAFLARMPVMRRFIRSILSLAYAFTSCRGSGVAGTSKLNDDDRHNTTSSRVRYCQVSPGITSQARWRTGTVAGMVALRYQRWWLYRARVGPGP